MRRILPASLLFAVVLALATQPAVAAEPPARPDQSQGPHVTLVASEDEYHTDQTFPAFARLLTEQYGCRCTVLLGHGKTDIPGLDALKTTDVLILFVRRRPLPKEQLDKIRAYLDAGKPLVALRTSCHGFLVEPGKQAPAGTAEWPEFDHDVLGGNYHNHLKNAGATIQVVPAMAGHLILAGVPPQWTTNGTLYRVSPVDKDAKVLLTGTAEGETEPVAWTHSYKGGRVFYTELGHQDDFAVPQFRTLLVNAVFWVMDRPTPTAP